MIPPEPPPAGAPLLALPDLPRREGQPAFAAPWQAQAFALAVTLCERGHFTWREWTAALAEQIRRGPCTSALDAGSQYYHHWLAALEQLVCAKGLSDAGALAARRDAWAEAFRHTPHGKPVELTAAPLNCAS